MFEYELEAELNHEFESELEGEYESEQFLGGLLRRVAPVAIRAVGSLLGGGDGEFEDEYEYEYEKEPFLGAIASGIGSLLGESEYEFESEYEATQAAEYDALMEHLAYSASQAQSEAEAEAFLGALIPLAVQALPFVTKAAAQIIPKVAPKLIQGVSQLGQKLHRSPSTRPLLKTLPTIAKGTVNTIARQAAKGQPVTEKSAVRALAGQTAQVLGKPKVAAKAMKRSRVVHNKKCPNCNSSPRQRRLA